MLGRGMIEMNCKHCGDRLEVSYHDERASLTTVRTSCTGCGAVGESECETSALQNPGKNMKSKNQQKVLLAVISAAANAKIG